MFVSVLAAGLILSAGVAQETVAETPVVEPGASAEAPKAEAKKPKCRSVRVTGSRSLRRICSDNPEADAAAAAGVRAPSSTMGRSQQGNINTN